MKAARLYGYDENMKGPEFLKIEDVPEPRIEEPDDAIVRIGGAGLCRTDLHIVEGLWDDALVVDPPYILGHENAGWVEAAGDSVRHVRPGDAVIVSPALSDGVCKACLKGQDNLCANLVWLGIQRDGGFAELALTKGRNLIKLPEGIEPKEIAPLADAGLTAYHAVKKAVKLVDPDATVVVVGVGGLGHVALQVLMALTTARIVAVDMSELALELAREIGVEETVKPSDDLPERVMELTGGTGADAVLDFVGEEATPSQSLAMLAMGGYYFVIGYGGNIEVPTMDIIAGEKNIIGNLGGTAAELKELVGLAGAGKVGLTVREYALADINRAIEDLRDFQIKGRAVLVP